MNINFVRQSFVSKDILYYAKTFCLYSLENYSEFYALQLSNITDFLIARRNSTVSL